MSVQIPYSKGFKMLKDEMLKDINILYIEDDEDTLEIVSDMLNREVNKVMGLRNAALAMEFMELYPIDIIISDIKLAGNIDGIDLAGRIRTKYPNIPIILTSAFTDNYYLKRAIETNISTFFNKPIDINAILKEIIKQTQEYKKIKMHAESFEIMKSFIDDSNSLKIIANKNEVLHMSRGLCECLANKEIRLNKSALWIKHIIENPNLSRLLTLFDKEDVNKKVSFTTNTKIYESLDKLVVNLEEVGA